MRRRYVVSLTLLTFATVIACKKPSSESEGAGSASDERERAARETGEAADALRDYAYAQKEEFVLSATREIAELTREMERLKAEADHSAGAARADAEAKLELLKAKLAAAQAEVDEAKAATAANWQSVQDRYKKLRTDLRASVRDMRVWLSETIKP